MTLALFIALSTAGTAQTDYTDDFSSTWLTPVTSFVTGSATEGLSYVAVNADFVCASGFVDTLALLMGLPASVTITSRDGQPFWFKSIWIDTLDDLKVVGNGSEGFTESITGPAVTTVTRSGAGSLVTSVVIETASGAPDFDVYFDNVSVTFGDGIAPDLVSFERQTPGSQDTNADSLIFRATFDEDVQYVTANDFDVTGTTADVTNVSAVAADMYDLTVSGGNLADYNGTVGINLAGGQNIADLWDNALPAGEPTTDETYLLDNAAPTDPTPSSSSHTVWVWDKERTVEIQICGASDAGSGVDGFEVEWDKSATWIPSETKEQEETWTGATFTAPSDGDWYFHIATVDNAGNWTSTQHLGPFKIDTAAPSVPAGLNPANGSYTADTSPIFSWTASTDTAGSGIDNYRIVVTGPVNRDTYVSDTDYNPTLSEGTFTWKVYARDNAGNRSADSTEYTLHIDTSKPFVTIDQASGQADPATSSPVLFTAVFNEPIDYTTFTSADVSVAGTATTGAVAVLAINCGTTFEVSIVVTSDGTVTASLPAGRVEDFAGNPNMASTSTDNTVTYDTTPPTVVTITAIDPTPTNADMLRWEIVFSEPVTGFDRYDLSRYYPPPGGGPDGEFLSSVVTGSGATYVYTLPGVTGDGEVSLTVNDDHDIWDLAGNLRTEGSTGGGTYVVDNTPPTVVTITAIDPTPTNADTLRWEIVFSEAVTGFDKSDLTFAGVGQPSKDYLSSVLTGSGDTYTYALPGVSGDGGISLAVSMVHDIWDLVGNLRTEGIVSGGPYLVDNTDPIDATPSSLSHTVGVWDADNTVDVSISGASDSSSGVDGFEVEWDKNATWTPTQTKDHEETWAGATYTATSDGDWYFQIATVDNAGNWTSTQHLGPFRIDTTPPDNPSLDCTSHTAGEWSNNDYVTLYDYTTSSDTDSGIDGYAALWTTTPALPPMHVKTMEEIVLNTGSHRPDGDWYYHIATVDNAGNWSNKETYGPYRIDTVAPTNPLVTSSTHMIDVWSASNHIYIDDLDTAFDALSGTSELYFWWISEGSGVVHVEDSLSPDTDDTIGVLSPDGIWYFDCETRDAAGNASTPLHFGPFKIDTTAPVISDAPSDQAITIAHGSSSGVVSWEEPTAVDAGCGLATLTATHNSGDSFSVGTITVTYTATDVLGNTSTASFDVVVTEGERRFSVEPASESGSFLDRCLDLEEGEEPPMAGLRPLTAIYEGGEAVGGACSILNPGGQPVRGCYIHVYIYRVNLDEHPETVALLDHWIVGYDSEAGAYCYSWDTAETAPGTYDIYLAFPDGSGHTCRIQLIEPVK